MKATTKITVNINKSLWAAFNLFAHPDFAIRRDTLIANWIYRFFGSLKMDNMSHLRDEVPDNQPEWKHITRDLRRTFKNRLTPAVITLSDEMAGQLNTFCEEKSINRDRFIEELIYQSLLSDHPSLLMRDRIQKYPVLHIGPLDLLITSLLQAPYRRVEELSDHTYFIVNQWDERWQIPNEFTERYMADGFEDESYLTWIQKLIFTDADVENHKLGIFPSEKIMTPSLDYWVFLRGYRHHIFVGSTKFSDPDVLRAHVKKHFSDLLSPPAYDLFCRRLDGFSRNNGNYELLKFIYESLAKQTAIRDLGFERIYDAEEEFFDGLPLFGE